jgi:hypothetical protein
LRGNEAGIGKTGLAIRLTEPDLAPIFAHVLPLTGSDFRTRLQPAAIAAVFIGAPPDAQEGADAVAAAFGLTPAATSLLAKLFAARTLNETAPTLGITRPTAKTPDASITARAISMRRRPLSFSTTRAKG